MTTTADSMSISGSLVLAEDVTVFPVSQLSASAQLAVPAKPGDFAVTRPRSRMPSKILDADAAELLKLFRAPQTLVDGIIRFSRERHLDPEKTLEQAYPLFEELIRARFVVAAGSEDVKAIEATLQPGQEVEGFRLLLVLHVADDVEVHQGVDAAGRYAAIKFLRAGAGPYGRASFERELDVLRVLREREVDRVPRLLHAGEHKGRPFMITSWCRGAPLMTVADEYRSAGDTPSRMELALLCTRVLRAYSALHRAGIVHGDVHPLNVLIEADGQPWIIDFGLSRHSSEARSAETERGGVAFFQEPEYARALLAGQSSPPATPLGEQYALACLIYHVLTGVHYVDFSLERVAMLRQINESPPVPLAERGAAGWSRVQDVLWRALAKDPAQRSSDLADLTDRFAAAAADDIEQWRAGQTSSTPGHAAALRAEPLRELEEEMLQMLAEHQPLYRQPLAAPNASVNYGAAGIAFALCRLAQSRQDAKLLSLADLWLAKAMRDGRHESGFINPALDITSDLVGNVSIYHTLSGVHCVACILSHMMGDVMTRAQAVASFIAASRATCDNLDLTLGRSSTVVGCALLYALLHERDSGERAALRHCAAGALEEVWQKLDTMPPIRECRDIEYLGIAHGWAGFAYAALLWASVSGEPLRAGVDVRLAQIAEHAEPSGRGVRWRWTAIPPGGSHEGARSTYMPGWCNGSAGMVFLWTLAHRVVGDPNFLKLAEESGHNAWDAGTGAATLCCGAAGQTYAQLNLYRHTRDVIWLRRACNLAERGCISRDTSESPAHSLYKGRLGLALLAGDLAAPEHARMPLFETWV